MFLAGDRKEAEVSVRERSFSLSLAPSRRERSSDGDTCEDLSISPSVDETDDQLGSDLFLIQISEAALRSFLFKHFKRVTFLVHLKFEGINILKCISV